MKIFGIGLNGLVGTRVQELLANDFSFESISLSDGVDITEASSIRNRILSSDARVVLHLAGKTDVDECEKDKPLGKNGKAWKVNVDGTKNIVAACAESKKRILFMSTDFVFDGQKSGEYTEEDEGNPINWYGTTKFEAEKIVSSFPQSLIIRIAYPYGAIHPTKKDFVAQLLGRFSKSETIAGVTDHVMTPTFIPDIAQAIKQLILQEKTGLYHVVGSEFITAYHAIERIGQMFGFSMSHVRKTTRSEFFRHRAPRPFCLQLNNAKIQQLGIGMKTFGQGLEEIKTTK